MQNSLNPAGPWNAMNGTLADGYSMCIDPAVPFYYLDINTLTASQSLLANNLNPFTLSQTGLPAGWLAYWAAKGVVSGATGWQGVMWQIINGNTPIFYIYYTGGDYQLIDGLTYQTGGGIMPLRVSGDYPQGTYTYNGTVTDVNGCVSLPFNVMTIFNTIPVATAATLQNSLNPAGPWSAMNGTLAGGYSMCIDPVVPFYYLDINTMTVSESLMANTLNPFTLSQTGLPAGWLAYWAARGVVSGATGWQGVMWQIINGSAPIFYIYYTGGDYQLIDGLTYQTGGGIAPLRISGDYPQGTYTYNGTVTDVNGCVSLPFNVMTTFNTVPVPTISGPTPVCLNSTGNVYTTESGMTGYIWAVTGGSITAGGSATDNTVTVTWTSAGTESVSVNYTDVNGCTAASPTVYDVVVNPLPGPTISGPTPVCLNSTGNVYITESGMAGYSWTVTGGTITSGGLSTDNTVTVTWITVGAESVSVNYTDINGCTAGLPTVYPVTVLPDAAVTSVTGTTPLCIGATATYTANGVVLGGGTGTWSSDDITVATVDPVTGLVTAIGDGTCNIIFTITGGCNGTPSAQQSLTVLQDAAVASVTGATPLCIGATAIYTANGVVLGGGTGTWSSDDITVATVDPVTGLVTAVGAGTCNIIFTITGGCNTIPTAQQSLTVLPDAAVASVSGATPLCIGATALYTASGVVLGGGTGAWSSDDIAVATVDPVTGLVTAVGAGTCNIIFTITGGCNGTPSAQQSLTVTPDAAVASVTGTTPLCIGATATYTANGVVLAGGTGAWSSDDITVATVDPLTGVVTAIGVGTCNIIFTITGGCNGTPSAQQSLTVLPDAAVASVSGATPLCIGATATYTAVGLVLGGGTGTWSSDDIAVATVDPVTGVVTAVGVGTCNIIFTITGGCNATPSAQQSLTVLPNAAVASVSGTTPLCIGVTATYTASGIVLGGGTGAWSSSNIAVATVDPITGLVTAVGAGTCNIIFTITGGCNGTPFAQQSLTVLPDAAVASVTGPTPLCIGAQATYTANGVFLSGGTGTWSSSDLTVATVNPATGLVTAVAPGTCNIIFTITGGCNTTPSAQQSLTVSLNNTIALSSAPGTDNQTLCALTPITNITYATTGATGATYSGLPSGVNGSWSANVVTISGSPTVSGTFNYTVTLTGGCAIVTASGTITVNALPVPVISGPASVCINSTGNIYTTQTGSGIHNYVWAVVGGTVTGGGTGTDNTVTVTWNTAGTESVSVNYTNNNGCTASSPTVYSVVVHALPVPTITGQTNMCVNSGYYNYTTETGMLNYQWVVSSGGIINYGSGTYQIQVSWIAAGAQTVSVIYASGTGCNAVVPTVLNVTVDPLPDQAGAITGPTTVCAGDTAVVYSVAQIPNATTYVWALPPNASIVSGAGTNTITVDFGVNAASGVIIVYGNNVCGNGGNSPALAVTINPLPDPAGTISGPSDVCAPASGIVYSVAAIPNATFYLWTLPVGVTITSGDSTRMITVNFAANAASGTITVKGANACGNGTVSPNFAVTVTPTPAAPVITDLGDTLHSSAPTGNQWYYNGTLIVGATSQTYVATQSGEYWDIVTINGCASDTSNNLNVIIIGIAPHSASTINLYPVPNSGRFNVSITNASDQSYSIRVYNNLGIMIYDEGKVDVNGTLNKVVDIRPVPNGMYTVIISSEQETIVRKIIIDN
jgi:uncharacterized protein YjdB